MHHHDKISFSRERGSAIFIIMVAVGLFAALSFTVSSMVRSGGSESITTEKAKIYAGELVDYARAVRQGVQQLRINGCTDRFLSFQYDEDQDGDYNDADDSYHNANAPTDHSCHVFHPDGAGLRYIKPVVEVLNNDHEASFSYGDIYFTANACIRGVGTDNGAGGATGFCDRPPIHNGNELIIVYPYLKKSVCEAVNDILKGDPSIPADSSFAYNTASANRFTGGYGGERELANGSDDFEGTMALCFQDNGTDKYDFYQVLIAR